MRARDRSGTGSLQVMLSRYEIEGALGDRLARRLIESIDAIALAAPPEWMISPDTIEFELDYRILIGKPGCPGYHFWTVFIGTSVDNFEVIEGDPSGTSCCIRSLLAPLFDEIGYPYPEPTIYSDLFCKGTSPIVVRRQRAA